jgi:hypothetical protein
MKKLFVVIAILILSSVQVYTQGKIISKEDAEQLFGPVRISKEIPTENLKQYITRSVDVVMFKIMNNDLYILDNKRNALLPDGITINNAEVFSMYSISVVQELISNGNSTITYIEKRKEVLTITNGNYTLEYAYLCPPFCPK